MDQAFLDPAERFTMKSAAQFDRGSASGAAAPADLGPALDLLWTRFLPEIRQRVDLLEAAALDCASNRLSAAQHEAARAAAHKLAGSLGTFGLARGTALAREFELAFSNEGTPSSALAQRLTSIAAELRTIVDSHK
jgi:HPt (histidine-containing phosphotransfer) domain-containing protein